MWSVRIKQTSPQLMKIVPRVIIRRKLYHQLIKIYLSKQSAIMYTPWVPSFYLTCMWSVRIKQTSPQLMKIVPRVIIRQELYHQPIKIYLSKQCAIMYTPQVLTFFPTCRCNLCGLNKHHLSWRVFLDWLIITINRLNWVYTVVISQVWVISCED